MPVSLTVWKMANLCPVACVHSHQWKLPYPQVVKLDFSYSWGANNTLGFVKALNFILRYSNIPWWWWTNGNFWVSWVRNCASFLKKLAVCVQASLYFAKKRWYDLCRSFRWVIIKVILLILVQSLWCLAYPSWWSLASFVYFNRWFVSNEYVHSFVWNESSPRLSFANV